MQYASKRVLLIVLAGVLHDQDSELDVASLNLPQNYMDAMYARELSYEGVMVESFMPWLDALTQRCVEELNSIPNDDGWFKLNMMKSDDYLDPEESSWIPEGCTNLRLLVDIVSSIAKADPKEGEAIDNFDFEKWLPDQVGQVADFFDKNYFLETLHPSKTCEFNLFELARAINLAHTVKDEDFDYWWNIVGFYYRSKLG